jgi:hypothetical protein
VHKTLKAIGLAACLWAVIAISGGQWVALQAVAWVRMTMEFSQHTTLGTAITKTLSGKYPCELCVRAQQGMHHDQQQPKKTPWLETERVPEALWEVRCLTAPPAPLAAMVNHNYALAWWSDFTETPPTPPPRA